ESGENPSVLLVRQMKLGAHRRRQRGERLAVEVVDGRREDEDAQHPPAPRVRHWNSMVATSPTVASLAFVLGKYSMVTRRGAWRPQVNVCSPPPRIATWDASGTSSRIVFALSTSTSRRACLPMQSTCFSVPAVCPEGFGPSHQATGLSPDAETA